MSSENYSEQYAKLMEVQGNVGEILDTLENCANLISTVEIAIDTKDTLPIRRNTGKALIELKNDATDFFKLTSFRDVRINMPKELSMNEIKQQIEYYASSCAKLEALKNKLHVSTCRDVIRVSGCSSEPSDCVIITPPSVEGNAKMIQSPTERASWNDKSLFMLENLVTSTPFQSYCK